VRYRGVAKRHHVEPNWKLASLEQILVDANHLQISPSVMDARQSPPGRLLKREADVAVTVGVRWLWCDAVNECHCVVHQDTRGFARGIAPDSATFGIRGGVGNLG
jgi:hypothetical protein